MGNILNKKSRSIQNKGSNVYNLSSNWNY